MEDYAAKPLVKDALEHSFNKERFIYLIKNMLNHVEDAPFSNHGSYIYHDFSGYISKIARVGKYVSPEDEIIDILIVHLAKDTSLDRARTMQRNFVAKYLNGSRGGILRDAALVAFVAPNGEDWRFSFVKMDYKKGEHGKIKEELTPARRYSFLVGENENSHTAQSRLMPLLRNDEDKPLLAEIEDAFSVEKVTQEFFENYRALYLRLKESLDAIVKTDDKVHIDFKEKNINTVDFSKKLLGQIVFLYFLQKKGWFGVPRDKEWGSGSKHFLRELFNKRHSDYNNFFNDILNPLFYEALRREHADDYYSRFNCRIPFLNGGLFDPIGNYNWVNLNIQLPNSIFSNKNKAKGGDIGDGILDVYDRYNFTVKEDEPLEKEVAVDPEMLGKVFENLLEVKDRRSKGTYYTPREIVHYMCQESLVNYLAAELEDGINKEDIAEFVKHGEAAVEHDSHVKNKDKQTGKYSTFKLPESVRQHADIIDEKLATVRVCDPAVGSGAFPVGMMSEIVRTRSALTPYIGNTSERIPYTFKRHAIENCLYGVDIDPGAVEIAKLRLWLSLVVDEEKRDNIKPLPNLDYKIVLGNSLLGVKKDVLNENLFKKLKELKSLFFNETIADKKEQYHNQIEEIIHVLTSGSERFDFQFYFSEIFQEKAGFDIVIANPPYVKKEHLSTKVINELERHFYELKNGKSKEWSDDLYVHFIFQGKNIARNGGIISFITNDSFISLSSKLRVRQLLLKYNLLQLIRCPMETFDATIYTAVFVSQKSESQSRIYSTGYFNYPDFVYNGLGFISYDVVSSLPSKRFIFPGHIVKLYKKLLHIPKTRCFLRILDTGIDTGNVRSKIFFCEKEKENLHRLIQGRQMERWGIFWHIPKAKFKYCDIGYKTKPQKGIGRKGQPSKRNEYWNFRGDIENHHQPERLLMRQSDDRLVVAYQNEKEMGTFYTDNTLFTVLPNRAGVSLKFAMALLNSKLLNALYQFLSQEKGKTLAQIKIGLVNELPFVFDDQKPFIAIVNKILAITKDEDYLHNSAKQARVREYEVQIDQLVYELYGLTDEEIKIIEGSQ